MDEVGPAFPQQMFQDGNGAWTCGWDGYGMGGMSLRDYFAAAAMTGLLAAEASGRERTEERISSLAYKQADAMLGARRHIPTAKT